MSQNTAYTLRAAEPRDVPAIVGLIRELAEFEQLSHLVETTPEKLHPHLFGERPVAECIVAEAVEAVQAVQAVDAVQGASGGSAAAAANAPLVGFALFFTNFSTFRCRPGLYLEDLYVQPAWRGCGLGKALLQHLGALAVARGCGRFEWSVLDWNASAIAFYQRMGAQVLPDWRICRVSGEALQAFGRPEQGG